MTKENMELKKVNLKIRVSESEYELLKGLARDSFMSVSNYARQRLFEDIDFNLKIMKEKEQMSEKSKFACDHDREVMRYVIRTFLYTRFMADKVLDSARVEECNETAREQLKKWRYDE